MTWSDDPLQKRIETVGRILPHVEAKIVDPLDADCRPLPLNTDGELLVRGYNVSPGYYGDPETTKTLFRDDAEGVRWLITGDIAAIDEDGFLHINGRISACCADVGSDDCRGPYHPRRRESVALGNRVHVPVRSLTPFTSSLNRRLDGVADASVVGVPDATLGEVVGVFVQRKDTPAGAALTADALRKHVKSLSPQATPAHVWFLGEAGAPASYPATVSGKVRLLAVELR